MPFSTAVPQDCHLPCRRHTAEGGWWVGPGIGKNGACSSVLGYTIPTTQAEGCGDWVRSLSALATFYATKQCTDCSQPFMQDAIILGVSANDK